MRLVKRASMVQSSLGIHRRLVPGPTVDTKIGRCSSLKSQVSASTGSACSVSTNCGSCTTFRMHSLAESVDVEPSDREGLLHIQINGGHFK